MARKSLFAIFCSLFSALGYGQVSAASPRVGERHGDFTLARIDDGKPVSLSDYRGKKLLLIHFASW